jgi:viroplasmin and RNaseH domain-containing protein
MDDDGSALRVGAKYKSFTDLECALKIFQQDNYVQLYRRGSRKLGTGSKYKNMEVAESAADFLIYKELDYSCILGGTHFSSISSGQCPNTR